MNGGGWLTNIGNAFIDYGVSGILKKVFPKSEIHLTSSSNKWMTYQIKKGILGRVINRDIDTTNVFSPGGFYDYDYVVQCGACLGEDWYKIYGEHLEKINKSNTKLLLIGVGMTDSSYDKDINKTKHLIEKLQPYVFISRDNRTYEAFKDIAVHSYNGIDCAFFLNDYYNPEKFNTEPFVVLNFDKHQEPHINFKNKKVIRTHHSFWYKFSPQEIFKMKDQYYNKNNILISEIPEDYLDMYMHAEKTYSDRVHACVATLSYGNPARLFSKTSRSLLLERIGAPEITKKLAKPNINKIKKEKEKQLAFLAEVLQNECIASG